MLYISTLCMMSLWRAVTLSIPIVHSFYGIFKVYSNVSRISHWVKYMCRKSPQTQTIHPWLSEINAPLGYKEVTDTPTVKHNHCTLTIPNGVNQSAATIHIHVQQLPATQRLH